ncbi:MAG TPA: universal stress protein [Deltaproteobacteria bacterium]|nr:universal stress protein [Deltaproteobacteria bacterium]
MSLKIMILSDSFHLRTEAIRYSIALAKRLDAVLVLLILLPFELTKKTPGSVNTVLKLQTRAADAIRQPISDMERSGVPVESTIRIGNPRSELLKFLAESGKFHSIVWGGGSDSINEKSHWTSNLEADVKYSVLVPFIKPEQESGRRSGRFSQQRRVRKE